MASSNAEKSKVLCFAKCPGGLLSCLCWLLSAGLKVSTLVVLLALLATVHQLRSTAEESSLRLETAERDLANAISQEEDATRAYKEMATQMNQLQTDLADSHRKVQELQVELSKKQDLQRDLDRKTQEAKSAKQETLVLTQKVQELEAEARRKEIEQKKNQDASSDVQSLQSEKQKLQEKVSSLESSLQQEKSAREAASQSQQTLTQQLQETSGKLAQAEKLKEQLVAKEKAQEKKIEELRAEIKKLQDGKKETETQLASAGERAVQLERELEEALVKTAKTKEDSEAKTLVLQEALAEAQLMTKKFAAAEKEQETLKALNQGLEKKLSDAQKEMERQRAAQAQEAEHRQQLLQNEKDALVKENSNLQRELQNLKPASELSLDTLEKEQHDSCTLLLEEQSLASQKQLQDETNKFESEKKAMEHSSRILVAEMSSRDKQVEKLSAELDVARRKWTECDGAAKEKLSKLQSRLEECKASHDSAVHDAKHSQPKTRSTDGSTHDTQDQATARQQCEKEILVCKREKKDLETILREMFQQMDRKDKHIKELEENLSSAQNGFNEVEKALTDKVASLQTDLRACLVADGQACTASEDEESCSSRALCSQLQVRAMDLEASLKSSEEENKKLTTRVQKTLEDWTKANEYTDEMRQKLREAEQLASKNEEKVQFLKEQLLHTAEITHGDVVSELRSMTNEYETLLKKYDENLKPLQEKLEKARQGWIKADKDLVDLKKELKREKLRVSLCEGNAGQG